MYCIATYKITNTKESPKQRTLLLQNIMADGRTMFTVPIMSQTNAVHTSTLFNGKYKIAVMTKHPTGGRNNVKSSKYNHQNDKFHVKQSTVSKNHTEELP
jgi:PBP1b-binding outer membrane lipoprotein LpoB